VIVNYWQEHYEVQRRFVMMYCHTLNDAKLLYRQHFLAGSRKADYLRQQNSKTSQEPTETVAAQTVVADNRDLLEYLKLSREQFRPRAISAIR
jgi:hypothetical protein